LASFLAINFLNLVTCFSLIVGALQKKKNLLVPYLLLTTLYILIYVALGTWFFIKAQHHSIRNGVVTLIVIFVNFYCLIVVHRLYSLLKLREQNYPQFLRETNRQQQQAQNYETTYVKIP
jgi:thiol:disulfide interchange protein